MLSINTERLSLLEITEADCEFILELMNTAGWLKFIGDRGVKSVDQAKQYIENRIRSSYLEYGFGMNKIVLKSDDVPIGMCGLVKRDYLEGPDIGFAILPEYEGFGYAFEAAEAVLNHAIHELKLSNVMAITDPDNERSQKLIRKLGMKERSSIDPQGKSISMFSYR